MSTGRVSMSSAASIRRVLALATVVLMAYTWVAVPARAEEDTAAATHLPAWARVSPEQRAAARELGVPVAFENAWGMRFVLVPAGTFLMGSPASDVTSTVWDRPQHEVELTEAFYLQVTEVTNAQFRRRRPDHDSGSCMGGSLNDDQQPVVRVSWRDAIEFARWLSAQDAERRYTLPSEACWEYACRAGTTTRFYTGDTLTADQANVDGRPEGVFRGRTVDVATFDPNPWGLYNMHGNVAEYCSTWMWPYRARREVDPVGGLYPTQGRVLRGGAWWLEPTRSASRGYIETTAMSNSTGFRLACPVPCAGSSRRPPTQGVADSVTSSLLSWRRPYLWSQQDAQAGREVTFRTGPGAECWVVVERGTAADPGNYFASCLRTLGHPRPDEFGDVLSYSAFLDVMGHEALLFRIDGTPDGRADAGTARESLLGLAIVRSDDTVSVTRLGPELRSDLETEYFLDFCRSLRAK